MAKTYRRVVLDKNHWDRASKRVEESKIFKNSHRKIEANQVGYLGEIVFEDFLKKHDISFIDDRSKTTHDYVINGLLTLDLKTKDRTVRPLQHFDNSVPLYNHSHQRPDYYYFISLLRDRSDNSKNINRFTHAFIMGGVDIKTIDTNGKHWKKDDIDPSNGTKFWTDCLNINMENLIENQHMLSIFKKEKTNEIF